MVVDAQSNDRTREYARRYTDRVFELDWLGFTAAKEYAVRQARYEWVLWLDADERVPPALANEIMNVMKTDTSDVVAYEVARRAFFLGKWIKHCGWYPGFVIRLFKKQSAHFSTKRVHEHLDVDGSVGRFRSDLYHYTDHTLYQYFTKFNRYTSLAALDVRQDGRTFSLTDLLFRPPFLFFKMYIIRRGFLDGWHGFVLSMLSSAYVFIKYAKLWELDHLKNQ
jgi:glycosyltransferase involved in cell wall biosynthesis